MLSASISLGYTVNYLQTGYSCLKFRCRVPAESVCLAFLLAKSAQGLPVYVTRHIKLVTRQCW